MSASLCAPADQRQQHKRGARPEQDGVGRIVFQGAGQGRCGRHDQREAGDLEEAQQHEVGQDLVARGLVEHAVDGQEGRPVGRFGSATRPCRPSALNGVAPSTSGP